MTPFAFFLGLVAVAAKLSGLIGWSWWLVLLPFYFTFAVVIGFIGVFLVAWLLAWVAAVLLTIFFVICDLVRYILRR